MFYTPAVSLFIVSDLATGDSLNGHNSTQLLVAQVEPVAFVVIHYHR